MASPRPRRRSPSPERAPWPFWWAIIGVGLAGAVLALRAFNPPGPDGRIQATPALIPTSLATIAPLAASTNTSVATATVGPSPSPTLTAPPMPTPVNVPRSSRYSPIPLTPDPELAELILQIASGSGGRVGVAVKDLHTGRGVLIAPEVEFPAASIFKVAVMYEVFKQRDLGALSFDERLVFTQRHVDFDLGTLDRGAGSTIQLDEALERMITISDNSSAVLLTDRVGAFNINRDMAGLGLEHTRVLTDDLVTSPYDMMLFMEMLARGQGVSPQASTEMLQLLGRQRINDRIPRLLPSGASAAHKTGNLPGVVNDVGLVVSPETTFAIAVLISDTPREGLAANVIAEISAAAYRHFSSRQPSPTPTATVPPPSTPTLTAAPAPTNTLESLQLTATSTPRAATPGPAATSTPRR